MFIKWLTSKSLIQTFQVMQRFKTILFSGQAKLGGLFKGRAHPIQKPFSINNFDLIRLFAAFQVALHHSAWLLKLEHSDYLLLKITALFPGVPIFFFISGFLISKSYENSLSILNYAQNRILRIYPALIVCVAVSILSVWLLGYYETISVRISDILIWFLAQITIVQCYNPSFMRAYGVGVLDGSLWTIGVELQFYVLIPILYALFGLRNGKRNIVLIALITFFLILNRLYIGLEEKYAGKILYKAAGISFFPWIYMFLTGVFVQKNFNLIEKYLANRALLIFILYCSWALLISKVFHLSLGNAISPWIFMVLVPMLFSIAFSKRELSGRLLKKNDVSYGVYIYHMPIVNALLYIGISGTIKSWGLALICTFLMAAISWKTVEKPSLLLKRHPLNPLRPNNS